MALRPLWGVSGRVSIRGAMRGGADTRSPQWAPESHLSPIGYPADQLPTDNLLMIALGPASVCGAD